MMSVMVLTGRLGVLAVPVVVWPKWLAMKESWLLCVSGMRCVTVPIRACRGSVVVAHQGVQLDYGYAVAEVYGAQQGSQGAH